MFPRHRMWGFDSFKGLPDETDAIKNYDFRRGAYAATANVASLVNQLGGPRFVDFVIGFYSDSLTGSLRANKGMLPAMYIDIDTDLYISSIQALDWLFKNGLAIGCFLAFFLGFGLPPARDAFDSDT